jgi:hypothetical protein
MEDRRFHWYARDLYGFYTRCESSRTLSVEKRHFEHTPRVDRPPSALCYASPGPLPATQGECSETLFRCFLSRQARTADQGPVLYTGFKEIQASLRTPAA